MLGSVYIFQVIALNVHLLQCVFAQCVCVDIHMQFRNEYNLS